MKYYSTAGKSESVSFREAIIQGLAPDGGLYLPEFIPKLDREVINNLSDLSFHEIAFEISKKFIENEIDKSKLKSIIEDSFNFDIPLIPLDEHLYILELFHGPTLAFKDFGARFMARMLKHFTKYENNPINILVATSGDTGSAVANGFYGISGINVLILYPQDKVSRIQEQQLTTLGKNVTAIEIKGTFDDCQKLVKTAFNDDDLRAVKKLTSANSINIGRLLPQSFYYVDAYKKFSTGDRVVFTVPSGNLGNLTGGLIASKMGIPIEGFVAATNINRMFTDYIGTSKVEIRESLPTISNAMDVGNPSNLDRILKLYSDDHQEIVSIIDSSSFTDEETISMIKRVEKDYNYILDPHGSVGVLAAKLYNKKSKERDIKNIVLETAHPSKFKDIVEDSIGKEIELPKRLANCLSKKKQSVVLSNKFDDFKEYLLTQN